MRREGATMPMNEAEGGRERERERRGVSGQKDVDERANPLKGAEERGGEGEGRGNGHSRKLARRAMYKADWAETQRDAKTGEGTRKAE
jgi:hypothetical protein